MKKISLLCLFIAFMLPAISSFGQSMYKEENGIFITNGIGYRFTNNLDITATFGQDPYDRDRDKISLSGSYTKYLNQGNTLGYTLSTGLSYTINDFSATSKFTPGMSNSLFRKIRLSETFELVPTLSAIIAFPEFDFQAYGAEFTIPVSIKVFGDKRFVIGPGILLGQSNANSIQLGPDSFQGKEKFLLFGLAFRFNI